jgi:hypothetical protein
VLGSLNVLSLVMHSHGCQLRWAGATWVLTIAAFSLYLVWLGYFTSVREVVETYLVVGLLGAGTSLVAVRVLARLPYVAVALIATPVAGFLVGYTWGLLTYGSGAEDGTVWRGYGGAIVGAASAVAAWCMLRLAHRTLSRDTCPTKGSVEYVA